MRDKRLKPQYKIDACHPMYIVHNDGDGIYVPYVGLTLCYYQIGESIPAPGGLPTNGV